MHRLPFSIAAFIMLFVVSCQQKSDEASGISRITLNANDKVCTYTNSEPIHSIFSFQSESQANTEAERILKYTGLPANFEILSADVGNAMAVIQVDEDGKNFRRSILYNPDFMRRVKDGTRNNWSQISIMAHEIGHHLSGHTLMSESRMEIELEADKFSGFVLKRMGASAEDAIAAMQLMGSDSNSDTHPKKATRIAAILTGYNEAEAIERAPDSQPVVHSPERQGENGDDFYIITVMAVKEKQAAAAEVQKLTNQGYQSGYLWIPDYSKTLGNNEYYSVYLGPYYSQYACEVAVENYKQINPAAYGVRVSRIRPRLRIDGVGQVSSGI